MDLIVFVVITAIAMMCLAVNINKKSAIFGLFSGLIFITLACLLFIGDISIPSGTVTTMNSTFATTEINYTQVGQLYSPNPVNIIAIVILCLGAYVTIRNALLIRENMM